jgi:hypothetical protein
MLDNNVTTTVLSAFLPREIILSLHEEMFLDILMHLYISSKTEYEKVIFKCRHSVSMYVCARR